MQGAVIGSSVYANSYLNKWYAVVLLCFGVLFTLGIIRLRYLDERDRDLSLSLIVWAGKKLVGTDEKVLCEEGVLRNNQKLDGVLAQYSPGNPLGGDQIIKWSLWLFVTSDAVLAIAVAVGWLSIFINH